MREYSSTHYQKKLTICQNSGMNELQRTLSSLRKFNCTIQRLVVHFIIKTCY